MKSRETPGSKSVGMDFRSGQAKNFVESGQGMRRIGGKGHLKTQNAFPTS